MQCKFPSGFTAAPDLLSQLLPVQFCAVRSRPDRPHFTGSGAPSLPHDASNPLSAILGWVCQVAGPVFLAFPTPLPPQKPDSSALSRKSYPAIADTRGTCLRASTIAPIIRRYTSTPTAPQRPHAKNKTREGHPPGWPSLPIGVSLCGHSAHPARPVRYEANPVQLTLPSCGSSR